MHRRTQLSIVLASAMVCVLAFTDTSWGRGGGGRGGGGGFGGGGGGGFRGGGGGFGGGGYGGGGFQGGGGNFGGGRPAGGGNINRSPSYSRPGGGVGGGSPGFSPGGGARPPGLTPGGNRPQIGSNPAGGNRPGSIQTPGQGGRPQVGAGNRPSQLPSNTRPGQGTGSRPGQGVGSRPGQGNAIGQRPSQLPAGGNRPGAGNRPSTLPGLGGGLAGGDIGRRQGGNRADTRDARHDRLQDQMQGRDENRNARQEGRQENRGDRQQDRQDWRNENREDWQNWHDDHHGDHGDWYHDGWHGYGEGSWWNHMWSDHTAFMALGTTMWGLNRLAYWSGYGGYSNPYYDSGAGYGYDYSQSFAAPTDMAYTTADTQTTTPTATDSQSPGMQAFDQARQDFYDQRYDDAMKDTDKALASMPKDAVIHEFRALILFAQGKYREAAAALNAVLAVGPGWDWTTMAGLYPNVDVYTKQLRKLEDYVRAHPDAADARFLLAYHYLTGNHKDAAIGQLKTVIKLQPEDTVSAQLLATFGADVPEQEPAPKNPAPGIEESKLYGSWKATREGGSEFQLTLSKDHAFTWVYTKGKTRQEMKGVFAFEGDELALEPDAGGLMGADISKVDASGFNFRMVGAPASDKGLEFRRGS